MAFDLTSTIDLITSVNDLLTNQRNEITGMQATLATIKINLQNANVLQPGEVAVDENELNLVAGLTSQMMNNGSALVESIGLLKNDLNAMLPPVS